MAEGELEFTLIKHVRPYMQYVNLVFEVLDIKVYADIDTPPTYRMFVADGSGITSVFVLDERGSRLRPHDILCLRHGHAMPWIESMVVVVSDDSDLRKVGEFCLLDDATGASDAVPRLAPCRMFYEFGENGYKYYKSFAVGCDDVNCTTCPEALSDMDRALLA